MYSVEFSAAAEDQVTALPTGALLAFAEVLTVLALAPSGGEAYNSDRPNANIRAQPFGNGTEGLAIYLLLERQRRVVLLKGPMSSTCTACGQANPDGAKFCIECRTAQAARCPGCGTAAPSSRKFCAECGHALAGSGAASPPPPPPAAPAAAPNAGERKQVTVLFADVANSMDLAEALGPDELSQVMSGLFDLCRSAV